MDNEILVEDKSAGMPTGNQAEEAVDFMSGQLAAARMIDTFEAVKKLENVYNVAVAYLALMRMHEAKIEADTGHKHLQLTRCRSCQRGIVWLKTEGGKNMPVDADTFAQGQPPIFNPELGHISHFATCPNADDWRKN
jgi:hypothetical protein